MTQTKVLILYGCSNWDNISDNSISKYLNCPEVKVIQIWEIDHLKYYLYNEDLHLRKFILPLQIYKQKELNYNMIPNMYKNSNEIIDIFDNKKKFINYAKSNGLEDYIPYTYDNYVYEDKKVIIKEPINCYGYGITINNLTKINQEIIDNNVVQEYIYSNIEYAGHFLIEDGIITISKIYQKTFNVNKNDEYVDGNNNYDYTSKKIELDQKYLYDLQELLIPCKYSGICSIDFKILNDNIKVFEINPRLGGSLARNLLDLSEILIKLLN
jgi:predicted ATP-grasp superfamily ATP-dependent carboligase